MGKPGPFVPDAVLFDLDGTLVDTEPLHHESTNRVLAPFGHGMSWDEYEPYIGIAETEYWRLLRARFARLPPEAALSSLRSAAYLEVVAAASVPLLPGVDELISALEGAGIPRAVASSSPRAQIEATLRAAGLAGRFQAVRSGHDDVPRSKPAPDVYLAAAAALGVSASRCLAIEDSAAGVAAAVASGAFVVAVRSALRPSTDLSRAHLVVASLVSFLPTLRVNPVPGT